MADWTTHRAHRPNGLTSIALDRGVGRHVDRVAAAAQHDRRQRAERRIGLNGNRCEARKARTRPAGDVGPRHRCPGAGQREQLAGPELRAAPGVPVLEHADRVDRVCPGRDVEQDVGNGSRGGRVAAGAAGLEDGKLALAPRVRAVARAQSCLAGRRVPVRPFPLRCRRALWPARRGLTERQRRRPSRAAAVRRVDGRQRCRRAGTR
jgi:hypothetical protein